MVEITRERCFKILIRWAIVSTGLVALFWIIWYLIVGSIPVTDVIKMPNNWMSDNSQIQLPFSVSRWWDIPFAPVWSSIFVLLFTNNKVMKNKDMMFNLITALIAGLIIALGTGLTVTVSLAVALSAGLGAGLAVALGAGLGIGLTIGLIVSLITGIKRFFSSLIWKKTWHWLIVKEN